VIRRAAAALGLVASCTAWATSGAAASTAAPLESSTRTLTVCADPNNLPFSNQAREGFENQIASLIARDLHATLAYVWWAQRRGYARNTLSEDKCDLWPGVASGTKGLDTSTPYYRSTYVFVSRRRDSLQGMTLDDPRLRSLRIGIQVIGTDAIETPPAHALSRRGIVDNVRGYMLYGNYEKPNPPAAIMTAVEDNAVDVAVVWGPLAGYFAQRSAVPLRVETIVPPPGDAILPMAYGISVGIRRGNPGLVTAVDGVLARERSAIAAILTQYAIPLVGPPNQR
jgi:mxaJ protein